jgi:hypothetical protein
VSIVLVLLGMGLLGITTLLGKRLSGWQAWIPLLAAGFTVIPVSVYSIDQFLHFILLGVWGIPWMLVGYVVFTQAASRQDWYSFSTALDGTSRRLA